MIARDEGVVLVGFAVAFAPVVKLGAGNAHPAHDLEWAEAGTWSAPLGNKVDHLVASVMGCPNILQGSPRLFFRRTCSSISSARASLRMASLFSRASTFRSRLPKSREGDLPVSKAAPPFQKKSFATGRRGWGECRVYRRGR